MKRSSGPDAKLPEDGLEGLVQFEPQVQFDTLTWGKRLVGGFRGAPPFKVESFVLVQFERRKRMFSNQLERETWLPTPEDVVVQKLRWGRNKPGHRR